MFKKLLPQLCLLKVFTDLAMVCFETLTNSMADLRISKDSLILNHVLSVEHNSFCLMASLFVRRFINCSHSPPMQTFVPIMNGVNYRALFPTFFAYIHVFCLFVFSKHVFDITVGVGDGVAMRNSHIKKCCLSMLPETGSRLIIAVAVVSLLLLLCQFYYFPRILI